MTLSTTTQRNDYTSSGQTSFAFTWRILAKSDIEVFVDGVLKTLTTDYTILDADVDNPSGGNVTFVAGKIPSSGAKITLLRAVANTQELNLAEGAKMPAESLEKTLDRVIMQIQDIKEQLGRVPMLSISSLFSAIVLADPVEGKFLKWSSGNLVNTDAGSGGSSLPIDTGSAAPTSGYWPSPWLRINTSPAAGGNLGWICITAGTPGTWKECGLISE